MPQASNKVSGAHLRVIAPAGNTLFSKKCRSGGEPFATLYRDLNLDLPLPGTNALPLDQLTGKVEL